MHLLLKEEQTAAYSVEIWKRFRKWGGIPTGITQNVKDLLASREIQNIFENSDFVYMLNQAGGDRKFSPGSSIFPRISFPTSRTAARVKGCCSTEMSFCPFPTNSPRTRSYTVL